MNDNISRLDPRRVYSIPVVLTVVADAYVLADNQKEAERQAKMIDYNDLFSLSPSLICTTDDHNELFKFNDVVVSVVDISGIFQLPTAKYPPNEHPDFIGHPER